MAVKRLQTNATEKAGVRFVQTVVEKANSIFHPIHNENDIGNDGIVEFVEEEKVVGKSVAVQIKSGQSYFRKSHAVIPAKRSQLEYWLHHSLTIIGIVVDVGNSVGYWVNITKYIKHNREILENKTHCINVELSEVNEFSELTFKKLFQPFMIGKPLLLSFEEACDWSYSENYEKHALGIGTLFYLYGTDSRSWDIFFDLLSNRNIENLDPYIADILAHIPGHPDIFWSPGKGISPAETRKYASRISSLNTNDVKKLLLLVDEENGFQRGSVGQSVDAIINSVNSKEQMLESIVIASSGAENLELIEHACVLYAYYIGKDALPFLRSVIEMHQQKLDLLQMVINELEENDCIFLY